MYIGYLKTAFIVIIICSIIQISHAQKNDTIYLLNGDKITGEIKKFEYGLLFLSTDAMLVVNIPYDRINTIYSNKLYELRIKTGERYFGAMARSKVKASLIIVTASDSIEKPIVDIVHMAYIKTKFFQRIDGTLDVGMSYTKASDVLQYTLAGQATYRIKNYAVKTILNSIITDQKKESVLTRNNDFSLGFTRYLPKKWFVLGQEKFQQNTELQLEYRFQSFAGPGYDFLRTNKMRLYGIVGINFNIEKPFPPVATSLNFEGVFSINYRWDQYRHPKVDVTTGFSFYPSITIPNRYRFEYDLNAKFEIINDLFFSITIYENFDNKTIYDDSERDDYGIVTSLGYKF